MAGVSSRKTSNTDAFYELHRRDDYWNPAFQVFFVLWALNATTFQHPFLFKSKSCLKLKADLIKHAPTTGGEKTLPSVESSVLFSSTNCWASEELVADNRPMLIMTNDFVWVQLWQQTMQNFRFIPTLPSNRNNWPRCQSSHLPPRNTTEK